MERNSKDKVSKPPKVRAYCSIEMDLWTLARSMNIEFSDLLEWAIEFKEADNSNGVVPYPECNLTEKLKRSMIRLSEVSQELNNLKEQNKTDPQEDIKEVFGENGNEETKRE